MNRAFVIKVKTQKKLVNGKLEEVPLISWMKPEMPYGVLEVWKYEKKDKETGNVAVITRFLIGDQDTGLLHWVDSHGILFVGVI